MLYVLYGGDAGRSPGNAVREMGENQRNKAYSIGVQHPAEAEDDARSNLAEKQFLDKAPISQRERADRDGEGALISPLWRRRSKRALIRASA